MAQLLLVVDQTSLAYRLGRITGVLVLAALIVAAAVLARRGRRPPPDQGGAWPSSPYLQHAAPALVRGPGRRSSPWILAASGVGLVLLLLVVATVTTPGRSTRRGVRWRTRRR